MAMKQVIVDPKQPDAAKKLFAALKKAKPVASQTTTAEVAVPATTDAAQGDGNGTK